MYSNERYSLITKGNCREIVLLKGRRCVWGKCAFCDYIHDNDSDPKASFELNRQVLNNVTGTYAALEVINSGSVFELDADTLQLIKDIAIAKGITTLYFECYFAYKSRLDEIRSFFGLNIIFKCGIETFDDNFRNLVLNKNVHFDSVDQVVKYFESVCIMVGIVGQTREMIARDIHILRTKFKYGCVNVYCDNTTDIKADKELVKWFIDTYKDWDKYPNIDVLQSNTDFGVYNEN